MDKPFLVHLVKEYIMGTTDAIALLKSDHRSAKALFDAFKAATALGEKTKIVARAVMDLKIHATIEEEIFYPAARKALIKAIGKDKAKDMMNEADEEHHVAKLLIAELDTMKSSDDHWAAKFTVLAENIAHHVKEEEDEMFVALRKLDLDLVSLGSQMAARKEELKADGVPPFAEIILMEKNGIMDSPAEAARTGA